MTTFTPLAWSQAVRSQRTYLLSYGVRAWCASFRLQRTEACCPTTVCSRRRTRVRSAGAAETWYVSQSRGQCDLRGGDHSAESLGIERRRQHSVGRVMLRLRRLGVRECAGPGSAARRIGPATSEPRSA
jgi:hypothetical protein